MGVPSLLISGDEGICLSAAREYSGIKTVVTKRGIGDATWNRHPRMVEGEIEAAVREVLSRPLPKARPLEESYTMTLCYKEFQKARSASWFPGVETIDPYTVSYTAKTPFGLSKCRFFIG